MKYLMLTLLFIVAASAQHRKSGAYSNGGHVSGGGHGAYGGGNGGHHRGGRSLAASTYSGIRAGHMGVSPAIVRTGSYGAQSGHVTEGHAAGDIHGGHRHARSIPLSSLIVGHRGYAGSTTGHDIGYTATHGHRYVRSPVGVYGGHEAAGYSGVGIGGSHGGYSSGMGHLRGDTGVYHG